MYSIFYYVGLFFASYLVTTLCLYAMSARVPLAGFIARLMASYVVLLICACYGVFISIVFRLGGKQRSAQWATGRSFKYLMGFATGVNFKIEDPNNYLNTVRPAVFIGNHQTELDVLMLATIFPKHCSVTAKSSLKKTPFLGWFMSLSGTIFIDRANSNSARSAMAGAAQEMRDHKQSVYMFPEGTRSYALEPKLLPFKKGAFHLAVEAGVPIVPVVVANYSDVLYVQGYHFKSGQILVKVLKPIETKGLQASDVEDLTRDTRELMLDEMIALTEKERGRAVSVPSRKTEAKVVKASGAEATIS